MVRPATLLHFYRMRLRVHAVQELLAGTAIAVGVALVLSFQAVNSGVSASGQQNLRALAGDATLTLLARGERGFDARMRDRVAALPGVAHASAMLEQGASVAYGGRCVPLHLIGADGGFASLNGIAARRIDLGRLRPGLVLPVAVAHRLDLWGDGRPARLPRVTLVVRGRAVPVAVTAVLDREMIGPLSGALLGVASFPYTQQLTRLTGRATRVLVVPAPGREALVRAGLERLAAGRLTVMSREEELGSIEVAVGPIDDAITLLTAIGALVGLLFAFTATLPTLADRRRFVAALRMLGCRRAHVVQILAFQALVLGACASAVGVLLGLLLARGGEHELIGYLGFAFPLGTERTLPWQTLAATFAGGVLASCLAAAPPLLDLRTSHAPVALLVRRREPARALSPRLWRTLAACGLALLATAGSALLLDPAMTLVGVVATAVAITLAVPAAFAAILRLSQRPAGRWRLGSLALALRALRATSLLSLGLVAVGAVAVFGAVGMIGAHDSMRRGMYADFREYLGTADVWIAQPADDLALQSFDARDLVRRVAAVDGVRDVRSFRSSLLDVGDRRVWVVARPDGDGPPVPASQVTDGDARVLERRMRAGGWVAVSRRVADAQGVGLGGWLRLPTPTGEATYRVAAVTTNLGWTPGAVVMSARDHRRAWGDGDPSAIEADLDPGASAPVVVRSIRRELGSAAAGLHVETARARIERATAVARDGLAWQERAARVLLVAAALAMAAAIAAGTWQRRAAFGQLRLMGWRSLRLWCALLWETALVLGAGCLVGAAAGVYGQLLAIRWGRLVLDYPMSYAFAGGRAAAMCLLVFALALVATAVPGAFMARTPPHAGRDPST